MALSLRKKKKGVNFMKKTKLFSKMMSLVAAASLAASIFPAAIMAEETETTGSDKVVVTDWLLNADGSIRDGVTATAYYSKVYTDTSIPNGLGSTTLTQDEMKDVFTSRHESVNGWYTGWLSGTDEKGDWAAPAQNGYYMIIDLGEIRNINEIQFQCFNQDYFGANQLYMSTDENFTNSKEITSGNYEFQRGVTVTYDYDTAQAYRYIKIKPNNWHVVGLNYLSVKGNEVYSDEDLLHKEDGTTLKDEVKITVSHKPYGADDPEVEPKLKDVASITDGKYEIDRTNNGYLDKDKATSYVWEFIKEDKWVVADLGERKAITSIRALIYPGSTLAEKYFRTQAEIQVSNYSDFSSYKTLKVLDDSNSAAYKEATEAADNLWFEYNDATASEEYRYVRILSKNDAFGLTELQVKGYSLCSNTCYTNFDDAIISDTNPDGSTLTRVSNFANAGNVDYSGSGINDFKYAVLPLDKLRISFDGQIDASTVTNSSVKIKYDYFGGGTTTTNSLNGKMEVIDNTIYIDMYNFWPCSLTQIELTSDIKVNGTNIQAKTMKFRTGLIAPLPQVEGKVIKNVAAGKNVYYTDRTNKKFPKWHSNGSHELADNLVEYGEQGDERNADTNDIIIDLGNEYEIEACLSANADPYAHWNMGYFKFYLSKSMDGVFAEKDITWDFYGAAVMGKKIDKTTARYISIDRTATGAGLKEFAAFAYVPAVSENSVADAYYKKTSSNYTFNVEKDGKGESTILLARYKADGTFVDVNYTTDNKITFSGLTDSEGNPYTIKAFVWDNLGGLKPFTKAVVY